MGKLREWFEKCIADCSTNGELSASNNGQVLAEKLVDKIECDCKPDWNQNDETSPAFVKNRPFYENSLVSVQNPNMSGMAWYKVSSSVPSGDHSAGAAITLLENGQNIVQRYICQQMITFLMAMVRVLLL